MNRANSALRHGADEMTSRAPPDPRADKARQRLPGGRSPGLVISLFSLERSVRPASLSFPRFHPVKPSACPERPPPGEGYRGPGPPAAPFDRRIRRLPVRWTAAFQPGSTHTVQSSCSTTAGPGKDAAAAERAAHVDGGVEAAPGDVCPPRIEGLGGRALRRRRKPERRDASGDPHPFRADLHAASGIAKAVDPLVLAVEPLRDGPEIGRLPLACSAAAVPDPMIAQRITPDGSPRSRFGGSRPPWPRTGRS